MRTETFNANSEGRPVNDKGEVVPAPEWSVASLLDTNKITFYEDIYEYLFVINSIINPPEE